jgi:hypothetical protein
MLNIFIRVSDPTGYAHGVGYADCRVPNRVEMPPQSPKMPQTTEISKDLVNVLQS